MAILENLEPQEVFHFFEELSNVPRGTFDTKKVSDYLMSFAQERGLEAYQDDLNNVIIKKGGTAGYEDAEPVILQGHMDMVCEKRPGSDHDFKTQGLELYVEDGYVKAKDTTLGGDDGIAVAMALAILDSNEIPHPPIEALFTVDEESGMEGANGIDLTLLKGKKLLNIDSEEEGTLTVGCAGGIRYEAVVPVRREKVNGTRVTVKLHGLLGGHSGSEIHKQRGNAHKMMGRLLNRIEKEVPFQIVELGGGSKDNVIPMESTAKIILPSDSKEKAADTIREMEAIWNHEFMGEEPGLILDMEIEEGVCTDACDKDSTERVIGFFLLCPNGLYEYSRKLKGIVESSLSVGVVDTHENYVRSEFLIRSSVESKKQYLREMLEGCAKAFGGQGKTLSEYPAWQYNPDSEICHILEDTYREVYGKDPVVSTVHAGLECGIFLGKRPDLDCVSFGPDLLDIHSFNEKLDIASTQRTWEYLKTVLKKCK